MDSSVSLSVSGIQLYSNMNLIQMVYFQVSRPFPFSSYTKIQFKKVKQNYNGDIKVGDDITHHKNFLFLFSTNISVGIKQHTWRVDMQSDIFAHDFACLKKKPQANLIGMAIVPAKAITFCLVRCSKVEYRPVNLLFSV